MSMSAALSAFEYMDADLIRSLSAGLLLGFADPVAAYSVRRASYKGALSKPSQSDARYLAFSVNVIILPVGKTRVAFTSEAVRNAS